MDYGSALVLLRHFSLDFTSACHWDRNCISPLFMQSEINQIFHATGRVTLHERGGNLHKLNRSCSPLGSPCPGWGGPYLSEPHLRHWTLYMTGSSSADGSWDIFVTPKRLHEVVRGPHACLFCRLHLPTSCSNLWGNNLRPGRGGRYLQSRPGGRSVNEFNIAVVSPTVPRAVGERSELKLKGGKPKRITPDPGGFTPFF